MKRTIGTLSLLSATAIVVACSSNKPNPPMTPTTTSDAGADAGPTMVSTAPDAGAAPTASTATMPNFFTDAGAAPIPSATPMTDQALDVALDALVTAAAAKNAPKMAEEGTPGRQTMKEGDHFAMMINLQPNRCYTIIATALPGTVVQLDSKLFAPPFYSGADAGHSAPADKSTPIIGKGTAALCPIVPLAVPYKLDVAATKGAGRIAVHVYSRAK